MKDGYVNDQQKFTAAVETTREKIQTDGSVVVNCSACISRSSTLIATAIAAEGGLSFEAAVEETRETRPRARPHPKLQLNAYVYLVDVQDRTDDRQKLIEIADETSIKSQDKVIIDEHLSTNQSE